MPMLPSLHLLKSCLILFAAASCNMLLAQSVSEHIQIDQFGYLPNAEKVAVLSDPIEGFNAGLSYTPGPQLEVRRSSDDVVVFSAAPSSFNNGATHAQSGDRGWWFDFSNVTTPGQYYIIDPSTQERTGSFSVSFITYDGVMYDAFRAFFYNRANVEKQPPYATGGWTDGTSFLNAGQDLETRYFFDQSNTSLYRDLSGGWFDAGDQNKYVTFAEIVVHDLLSAYEENPQAFGDNFNIPESGNGISDVLDEVKFETDWLLKMSDPDGTTYIKMGNRSYAENTNTPPSANFDPRFYGLSCTSASLANAGMLAHAALVFKTIPSLQAYANTLETRAIACFNKALPNIQNGTLETNCDNGEIKAGDADRNVEQQMFSAVTAAIYLRELTGQASYDSFIDTYLPPLPQHNSYYWNPYETHINTALLSYMNDPAANQAIVNQLNTAFQNTVDNEEFAGWNNRDLYRAHIPDWAYHWGSNAPKSRMATFNLQAHQHGMIHGSGYSLEQKGREALHYFHGVNPLGLVMLSNMYGAGAERSVNEIYHAWFWDGSLWESAINSLYGPAPGFVTGGPNDFYEDLGAHDPSLSPPVGQPAQKSYLDDNNNVRPGGGDNGIYAINEPAIYYQSSYIRFLANYVGLQVPLPVELISFSVEAIDTEVLLSWEVGTESSLDQYTVERSADGTTFNAIGVVSPQGSNMTYTFTDANPLTGTSYYRLAMRDADGSVQYSSIRSVSLGTNNLSVQPFGKTRLTPNPAGSFVRLESEGMANVREIRAYNTAGQLAFTQTVTNHNGALDLQLDELLTGYYTLTLIGNKGLLSLPLIVE